MLAESELRDQLARSDLGKIDKLLICLSVGSDKPKEVKAIKALAVAHGLRAVNSWNVSSLLASSKGKASRVKDGWILTKPGRVFISSLGLAVSSVVSSSSAALRTHSASITNAETRSFVDEAIKCYEAKLFRAAAVLSWVGAVSLLYDYVFSRCLARFNAEALRRNAKHRPVTTKDDLARMKEVDFLDVLEGISVIGKSVRNELGVCLNLRNGCGHPNSLRLGEARVAAHIESLLMNVFARF